MFAMVIDQPGEAEVLQPKDVKTPQPGPHDVLVKTASCGVCYHDLLLRNGTMKRGVPFPLIVGHEPSGVVEAVGSEVRSVAPGDRVAATQWTGNCGLCRFCRSSREPLCLQRKWYGHEVNGAYAEYFVIQEESVVKVPPEVSLEEASMFSCAIGTAWHAVRDRGRVQPGETVLVTGAGGGLGVHTIQIAKLCGGRVIAVTGGPEKAKRLEELGADEVIVSREDFSDEVKRRTGGLGVDVVIDNVGGPLFEPTWRSIGRGGRFVLVGELSSNLIQINTARIFLKGVDIISTTSTSRTGLEQVMEQVRLGNIRPIVTESFPLKEAARVHRMLEERKSFGRVLLTP